MEKRYSQTEKEALGVVGACERLHMYLYGTEFEILTDHKSLQFICSKKSQKCEGQSLDVETPTVRHIPGKEKS